MGFEMVARLSCEANHQKLHYKHNLHASNPTIQKPGDGDNATEPPPPRHRRPALPATNGWQGHGERGGGSSLTKRKVSCLFWFFLKFSRSPVSVSVPRTVV